VRRICCAARKREQIRQPHAELYEVNGREQPGKRCVMFCVALFAAILFTQQVKSERGECEEEARRYTLKSGRRRQ